MKLLKLPLLVTGIHRARQIVSGESAASIGGTNAPETAIPFNPLSLPRTILSPMKRRGHVIFDVCTPAAGLSVDCPSLF